MISHIEVCNRFRVESVIYPQNTAIISITNIGFKEANIHGSPFRILRLRFNDIDPKWWGEIGATVNESHIFNQRIARDIKLWTNQICESSQVYTLVIHCEMGISRSGAIATAIAEKLGLKIVSQEKLLPNSYILDLMRRVL